MIQEMEIAILRLKELSEADQVHLAGQINDYLSKLENLREMVCDGLESGPATALDMDAIIQRGQEQLANLQKNTFTP
jgi:hypothetical protein